MNNKLEGRINVSFRYEAPRWARVSECVKQLALFHGLDLKIEFSRYWLKETGAFVCTGTTRDLGHFTDEVNQLLEQYNKRDQ